MANIAKLTIGEVLQNRKTGEVLTVKELTDTVAVLSNNKGYKLTAILKTYKRATEVITNVNISEAAMEANMQKATATATATTNTATTTTNTTNTLKAVITVQSEEIREFESKQNFVIKAYNNKKATATATAKTTAKTTATATAKTTANLTAIRDEVLSIAGEHFTLQQKTTYISVKFGNKCVMEVYNGKRAFSIAVSDKYLTAEQIALAKVTTQPFPNNCYFKVNSNNYSTILTIVKSAIANIVTTLNATAKATATAEQ